MEAALASPDALANDGGAMLETMAAVDQRSAYQRELQAGDTVVARTAMLEVRPKVVHLAHQMRLQDDDEIAAQKMLVAAHLDTNLRKSCPFPDAVVVRAQAALTDCELPWNN